MDPNGGRFVGEQHAEAWMERISVGETVKIKGEELEVTEIREREIVLKLLSSEDRMRKALADAASVGGLFDTIFERTRAQAEKKDR